MRSYVSIQREIAEVERAYSISLSNRRPRPELAARLRVLRAELVQAARHGREETIRQTPLVTDRYPSTAGRPARPWNRGDVATMNTAVQSYVGGARQTEISTRATVVQRDESIRAPAGTASSMQVWDLEAQLTRLRNAHRVQLANRQFAQAAQTRAQIVVMERRLDAMRASRGRANAVFAGKPLKRHHTPRKPVRPVDQEPQIPRQLAPRARIAYIDGRIRFRNKELGYYRKAAIIAGMLTPIGGVAAGAYAAAEIINIGKVQKIRRQLLAARSQAVGEARNADTRYFAPPVPTTQDVEALPTFATPAPANAEQQLVASTVPAGTVSSVFTRGKDDGKSTEAAASEGDDKATTTTTTTSTEGGSIPWLWIGLAAAVGGVVLLRRGKSATTGAK